MLPPYTSKAPGVIIFDLDLTLVNNEPLIQRLISEWFAGELGISFEESHAAISEGFAKTHDTYPFMAQRYGKPKTWEDYANRAVHQAIADQLHTSVEHNPWLEEQLLILESQAHILGLLTQAMRVYADRNIELLNISRVLHPQLVLGRDCTGGHTKRTPEPYLAVLERTARIGPNRWHIMVEDNPSNLKASAPLGFINVLVGAKAEGNADSFVHAAYPDVHEFLDDLIAGTFAPHSH